ncbi:hypothetical protein [Aeromonas sp. R7-1]|uniref:hypothetical protein n=1 Tax=Aeromonas sp. R7-1 TaxID=3138473 RepID=UPI0034A49CA8
MFQLLLFGQQIGIGRAHGLMSSFSLKLGEPFLLQGAGQVLARHLLAGQGRAGRLQRQLVGGQLAGQAIHPFGLLVLQQPALGHLAGHDNGRHRQQQQTGRQRPAR